MTDQPIEEWWCDGSIDVPLSEPIEIEKTKWRRLGFGGVVFRTDEAIFWYELGFLRSRRIEFATKYLDMAKIEEWPGYRVLFRFQTSQACPDEPPLEVTVLAFRAVPWWRSGEVAREAGARLGRWHQLEDEVFTRCKVAGRFTMAEGIALARQLGLGDDEGSIASRISNFIMGLIKSDRLDGFFDEEKGEYTAAALVHRTVTEITIDFNSLLSALGNKGVVLERLTCPACGGQMALPKEGNQVKCQYCGTNIYAMDIFEKFKGLLGL